MRWFVLMTLVGCGKEPLQSNQQPSICSDPTGDDGSELILSGRIIRETTDHSFNDDIVVSEEAHAAFTLRRYEGEDAPAPLTFSADVPFTGFPFGYTLVGAPEVAFGGRGPFIVGVEIFNHGGCEIEVGDFVNEVRHEVGGPQDDYEIAVQGLEDCDAEYAGGYCVGGR